MVACALMQSASGPVSFPTTLLRHEKERMKRWTFEHTAGVTCGYASLSYDSAATRERTNEEMDVGADRRRHPRLRAPFPAILRGKDASGESFEVNAVLDNISAGGLYVRLGRYVKRGTRLFAVVRLSATPAGWGLQARHGVRFSPRGRRGGRAWRAIVGLAVWGWRMVVPPSTSRVGTASGPLVAIRGVVIRTEPQLNGMCGVAVAFTHYRFL
jgi:hypothetical protein